MKIFIVLLLLLGAILGFGSNKIAPLLFKGREIREHHCVIIKSIGFLIVVVAAIITFIN